MLPINTSNRENINVDTVQKIMDTEEIKMLWRIQSTDHLNESTKLAILTANITAIPSGTFEMFHSLRVSIQGLGRMNSMFILVQPDLNYWLIDWLTQEKKITCIYSCFIRRQYF